MYQLIKEFCEEYSYEFLENYTQTKTTKFGVITIEAVAIVVKDSNTAMDALAKLSDYLGKKKVFDERLLELEGADLDGSSQYPIAFFPSVIKDDLGHL